MKGRALLFVLLLVAGAVQSSAQTTKRHWEIEAGTCMMNTDHFGSYDSGNINRNNNGVVYPTIALGFGYVIPKHNIGFFLSSFNTYAERILDGGPSLLTEREYSLHLMPEVRFYYYSDMSMRVYASAGAGVRYLRYSEEFRDDTVGCGHFSPTFQFSPLCFSFGHRLNFVMEVGFGRPYMPLAFKLSYLFL